MNFQDMIMRLNAFWAAQGCIIWQPHNEHVGAATFNPSTVLRVLGPEPWNVAYAEPSDRPADGRYGENPNRWYEYFQYQVILKPDPVNHMELYLQSLEALGVRRNDHDIRFVEDNWQSPSLAAWGLGWEVWLDGLEISQYTYFQQAAGIDLNPVAVEITYGLERIALFLQDVPAIPQITWRGDLTYGDLHLPEEVDYCTYNFEVADVERMQKLYDLFEEEAKAAVARGLVLPAHDYLLRCSHAFNLLDARGAIGVTQRAHYFARMRGLARLVAEAYLRQREALGHPLLARQAARIPRPEPARLHPVAAGADRSATFLLEIGVEELPAADLTAALEQLQVAVPAALAAARLGHGAVRCLGTPRRLAVLVDEMAPKARDEERLIQGPAAAVAYDAAGKPTRAAEGFARRHGLAAEALERREIGGKPYVVAALKDEGRPALELLAAIIPDLIGGLRFGMSMRWNETGVAFSRPIRWLVALFGDGLVDAQYAGIPTDRRTYGARPDDSPPLTVERASDYPALLADHGVVVDPASRRAAIKDQIARLAAEVGAAPPDDPDLLAEVTNLVERPVAIRGSFDPGFLSLPPETLVTVMKKHQRYFPLFRDGELMPAFITIANGRAERADIVRAGNAAVLRARFTDARFFYEADRRQPLEAYVPKLSGLSVQDKLGSYLDKTRRLTALAAILAAELTLPPTDRALVRRTAELAKADLATNMVIEFTSLQGVMGRYYAEQSGEDRRVAVGITEHYLPRGAGDRLPTDWPGIIVGLADRLDSLVGFFAAGLSPTSSADPYGLRRAALGLIQVLVDRGLPLSTRRLIELAAAELPLTVDGATRQEVATFVERRLQAWLLDQGYRYDLVDAALAELGDRPADAFAAVRELTTWADRPAFADLMRAYARAARITRDLADQLPLDEDHLTEPAARGLLDAYRFSAADLAAGHSPNARERLAAALTTVQLLAPAIDAFFKDVLVMDPDPAVRQARLGLLQHIAAIPNGVVDLTKVSGF